MMQSPYCTMQSSYLCHALIAYTQSGSRYHGKQHKSGSRYHGKHVYCL